MPHKNAGAMKFEPISSLSYDKYLIEIKRRQSLSAKRTNQLVSKETKLKNIRRAQALSANKRKSLSMEKIEEAKNQLKFTNKKITIAAISKISKLHRNTVSKYLT
jgi:cystathionine beta-lyase family protein involved in aluminum resistance